MNTLENSLLPFPSSFSRIARTHAKRSRFAHTHTHLYCTFLKQWQKYRKKIGLEMSFLRFTEKDLEFSCQRWQNIGCLVQLKRYEPYELQTTMNQKENTLQKCTA